jgi:hypothetical protein
VAPPQSEPKEKKKTKTTQKERSRECTKVEEEEEKSTKRRRERAKTESPTSTVLSQIPIVFFFSPAHFLYRLYRYVLSCHSLPRRRESTKQTNKSNSTALHEDTLARAQRKEERQREQQQRQP